MNIFEAAILGLVEGITEFLPVSSTGHLIIVSALLGLNQEGEVKRSVDAFNLVIQGGAILAVLGLYRVRVAQMIRGLLGRDAAGLKLLINLLIAFLPAAAFGVLLNDWIEANLFYPTPVMGALAVGGLVMIAIGHWQREFFQGDEHADPANARSYVDIEHLTWRRALIIGLLQCLAMWPGTSRSMMTIVGGMFVGMRPRQAAEFSFLLGLPTLGGACAYSALKNFTSDGPNMLQTLGFAPLCVGFVVASVSAALAVKWLLHFLNRHGLVAFGWYRLALCAVLAGLIGAGIVTISPDSAHQTTPIALE